MQSWWYVCQSNLHDRLWYIPKIYFTSFPRSPLGYCQETYANSLYGTQIKCGASIINRSGLPASTMIQHNNRVMRVRHWPLTCFFLFSEISDDINSHFSRWMKANNRGWILHRDHSASSTIHNVMRLKKTTNIIKKSHADYAISNQLMMTW